MLGILAFTLLPGSPWQHRRFKSPRATVHYMSKFVSRWSVVRSHAGRYDLPFGCVVVRAVDYVSLHDTSQM